MHPVQLLALVSCVSISLHGICVEHLDRAVECRLAFIVAVLQVEGLVRSRVLGEVPAHAVGEEDGVWVSFHEPVWAEDGLAGDQHVPCPDEDVRVLERVGVVPSCEDAHGRGGGGVQPGHDLHMAAIGELVPIAQVHLAATDDRHVVARKDADAAPQLALDGLDLRPVGAVHDREAEERRPLFAIPVREAHALVRRLLALVAALAGARLHFLELGQPLAAQPSHAPGAPRGPNRQRGDGREREGAHEEEAEARAGAPALEPSSVNQGGGLGLGLHLRAMDASGKQCMRHGRNHCL
mmetsp:Transcript_105184/g.255339  ORF Transcript_105184/g.255339 Transcript_105184/m.255339 type:complete len:295 (-) Transcript_105184:81-965(-)